MYEIVYTQKFVHTFPVEAANSYEEAVFEFIRMLEEGEVDLSEGYVEESSYEIKEVKNA